MGRSGAKCRKRQRYLDVGHPGRRGGNTGGAEARRRGIGAASGRFLTFLVECFSSNQTGSDNPSRQPQEKILVDRLFLKPRPLPRSAPRGPAQALIAGQKLTPPQRWYSLV